MIILPAIDIKDGRCVRLYKGDYGSVTQVADSILDTAAKFQNAGAKWLHMVDLDGAKDGMPQNTKIFLDVAKSTAMKVELGGGIRNIKTIEHYLENGISRVILGSAAVKNPEMTAFALKEYGDKIAIGIDAKNGFVATQGWLDTNEIDYIEMAKRMEDIGAKYIIYTDISKDGTLQGPNSEQLEKINNAVSCNIIASGGIRNIDDIVNLKNIGMHGAICGISLYKGTLDLAEALKIAE
ncbi:MAG: 1-(5-phosphoribosyl)-5-[Clostridia bacterium]|nr:1-(5-phosphoribosyl)-5-[(5-phosphoribosylamino)methylideneamino]imidazole-4-carboxamide isomerase [Clostridia bacterium]